jgi:hypothetical protein
MRGLALFQLPMLVLEVALTSYIFCFATGCVRQETGRQSSEREGDGLYGAFKAAIGGRCD